MNSVRLAAVARTGIGRDLGRVGPRKIPAGFVIAQPNMRAVPCPGQLSGAKSLTALSAPKLHHTTRLHRQ